MGLDMYLDRQIYNHCVWSDGVERKRIRPSVEMGGKTYDNVRQITTEFGYWRKANAIHGWFVENVQNGEDDCRTYDVSIEQLVQLRELCKEVIAHPEKAQWLLPTVEGSFFGSQEYDQYYFEKLQYTVDLLKDIEKSTDDFCYWSSW